MSNANSDQPAPRPSRFPRYQMTHEAWAARGAHGTFEEGGRKFIVTEKMELGADGKPYVASRHLWEVELVDQEPLPVLARCTECTSYSRFLNLEIAPRTCLACGAPCEITVDGEDVQE